MAVLGKKKKRANEGIPMSSTADIAFLLLIFFLVTTTFPKDKGLALVLPEANEEVEVAQQNVLHLIVQVDGTVEVKRGESESIQTVRARDVEGIWRLAFAENENLIAAVKTHPSAEYGYMVDVLDALQTANATRISLQLLEL